MGHNRARENWTARMKRRAREEARLARANAPAQQPAAAKSATPAGQTKK